MKSVFKSKTILINAVVALLAIAATFMPGLNVEQVSTLAVSVFAAVNIVLRLITKDAVTLFPDEPNPGE